MAFAALEPLMGLASIDGIGSGNADRIIKCILNGKPQFYDWPPL